MEELRLLDEVTLLCPKCGGAFLHQYEIEVWIRQKEDADEGTHVLVSKSVVSENKSMEGNPSPRRDGLSISFACENCDGVHKLIVIQHKGSTFLKWG